MSSTTAQQSAQTEIATPVRENGLPSPADLPASIVVIYDGKCKFCTKQVKRLKQWDGKNRLSFVSLHDPFVRESYPDLSPDALLKQLYVISPTGTRYGGAAAFRFLTLRLPRLWILAPIMHIPFSLPLWQWCYLQVAKRRYRLSKDQGEVCEDDACEIHFGGKAK